MRVCEYKSGNSQPEWQDKLFIRFLKRISQPLQGSLHITLSSGHSIHLGQGQPAADLQINSWQAIRKLFFAGSTGWAEAYTRNHWDSSNLTALISWALLNETALESLTGGSLLNQFFDNFCHALNRNSRRGSRRNIHAHYDLGNDFYRLWLDSTMSYSAAMFEHQDEDLASAQQNKYRRILQLLNAAPGEQVLEIGCGWGGFAQQARQESGLKVHGITLSEEQLNYARQRITRQNLEEDVSFSLTDYRDLSGNFSAVVSIEMFEAVGTEHWDNYFEVLKRSLKPGGTAVLQIITIDDLRFDNYRKNADFIQRYIFPGGMLPSRQALHEKIAQHGLQLEHEEFFGKDYARTLNIWRQAFEQHWPEIARLPSANKARFDEQFRRLWRYYLAYCEGGFLAGSIDVGLFVLHKPG